MYAMSLRTSAPVYSALVACLALIAPVCLAEISSATSVPRTLRVSPNGEDSQTCGDSLSQACRSISQAVANALDGDRILVAPGRYGDLNRNGLLGEEGEEFGLDACRCMIYVDKRIQLVSERGADGTRIEGINERDGFGISGIGIAASRIRFGGRGNGFTVVGAYRGIHVFEGANNVSVIGNRVSQCSHGIWNEGFRTVIAYNHADFNFVGVEAVSGAPFVHHNTAANNDGLGIDLGPGAIAEDNIVIGNGWEGVRIAGAKRVVRNHIADNRAGLTLSNIAINFRQTIERNNIVGNDLIENVESPGSFPSPGSGCGVVNFHVVGAEMRNNYWGSLQRINVPCNLGAGTVLVDPVSEHPFDIPKE